MSLSREAENRYRAVFDAARDAMIVYTRDGVIVEANPAACRTYGFSRDEFVGIDARQAVHPDARPHFEEFLRVAGGGGEFHCETVDRRRDGSVFPIEVTGTSFTYDGRPHLLSIIRDITDRRRAEEARRKSEFRFQRLVEHSPQSTQLFHPDGRPRQVNRAFERLFGITLDELRDYNILHDPELVRLGVMPLMERAFAGDPVTIEPIAYVPDRGQYAGQTRWAGAYVYPVKNDAGDVEEVVLVHNDVTDTKTAEEALRDREQRLRSLVEQSAAGIAQTDLTGRILLANDRYCQIVGYTADELTRLRVHDLTHPDDLAETTRLVASGAATGAEYAMEKRYVRKDGSVVWVAVSASIIRDVAGKPQSIMGVVVDISDRKGVEAALRESEARFRLMADAIPQIVWVTDAEGRALFFNRQWKDYTGAERMEITAGDVAERYVHPDDRQATMSAFAEAQRTGGTFRVEHRIRSASGEYRWFIGRAEPYRDPTTGQITRWFGASLDIHDRRHAEAALRESEERLRAAFQQTEAGIAQADLTGQFLLANDRYCQTLGRSREELAGLRMQDVTHPDDLPRNLELLKRALADGKPFVIEKRYVRPDGSHVWVSNSVSVMRGPDGRPSGLIAASVDVTERRRTEVALRESESRFRFLSDLAEQTRDQTDPEQVMATVARTLGEHLGASRCAYAEVEADSDRFTIRHDYTDGCASTVGTYRLDQFGPRAAADQRSGRTLVIRDVDAELAPAEGGDTFNAIGIKAIVCCPLVRQGRLMAMMAVHQTTPRQWTADEVALVEVVVERSWAYIERARAVRAVAANEARFRQLADAMPQMVWVTRPDGYHVYFNRRWYEFTGVPEGSTDGEGWNELFHPDDRGRASERWRQSLVSGEPYEIEYRLRHRSGEYRWTLGRALPIRDDRGNVAQWFGTCTEIDALKKLEQEREDLLSRERAARAEAERASDAKSEFLATLSHELRTPLTPVLLTVSLMESHPELPAELREDVAAIRRNVELESRLISDLLDLTRVAKGKLQLEQQDVDLHLIVRSAVNICQREASANLLVDLAADRHTVRGDGTRLQQVFWNLINNAIKFTPQGGTITIRTHNVGDDRVRVEVTDTGVGIDPAVLPRLFNAFEQGEVRASRLQAGLGLGLAISKKLAEAHGGTISATSRGRGLGSTFTVDLPVLPLATHAAAAAPQAGPAPLPAIARPLTVLLVEDHEPTLRVMERLLRTIGHRVQAATTVTAALSAAESDGYDLIISDLGLPDGSGLDLMRALSDRYAGRAIALTGYGMESDVAASRAAGFAAHLTKPVDFAALDAAIRQVVRD